MTHNNGDFCDRIRGLNFNIYARIQNDEIRLGLNSDFNLSRVKRSRLSIASTANCKFKRNTDAKYRDRFVIK